MADEHDTATARRPHKRAWIIGGAVAALGVGAAAGAYALHVERQADEVVAASERTADAVQTTAVACRDDVQAAQQTLAETKDEVADPSTYGALIAAVQTAEQAAALSVAPATDAMSLDQARAAQAAAEQMLDDIEAACAPLEEAVETAQESHRAYAVAEAQAKITAAIDAGEQTLAATEGKVDDNAVRQALRDALDSSKARRDALTFDQVGEAGAITADVGARVQAVDDAVAARDARIAAEQRAAEEAAAQAAAARRAAAQQKWTSGASTDKSSGSSGSTSGGSGGSTSSGSSGGAQRPPKIGVDTPRAPREHDSGADPNWDGQTTFG